MDVSMVEPNVDAQTKELGKLKTIMDKHTTDLKEMTSALKEIHVMMLRVQERLNEWTLQLGIPLPPKDESVINNQVEELVIGVESNGLLENAVADPCLGEIGEETTSQLDEVSLDKEFIDEISVHVNSCCDEVEVVGIKGAEEIVVMPSGDKVAVPCLDAIVADIDLAVDKNQITTAHITDLSSIFESETSDISKRVRAIRSWGCFPVFDPGIFSIDDGASCQVNGFALDFGLANSARIYWGALGDKCQYTCIKFRSLHYLLDWDLVRRVQYTCLPMSRLHGSITDTSSHFALLIEHLNALEDTMGDTGALNLEKNIMLQIGKLRALKLFEESFDACRDLVFEVTPSAVAALHRRHDVVMAIMVCSNSVSTKKSTHNIISFDPQNKLFY